MSAISKYRAFHQLEPRKIGDFHRDLIVPDVAICVGDAVNVLYRSDKLNPTTSEDEGWIDYIHEHGSGVKVYRTDRSAEGAMRTVPAMLQRASELYWLGDCLGFEYKDAETGKKVEAKGTTPYPELYAIPSGRALLVIQGKRRLLAMIWGGRLGVEPRGIVH